MPSRFWDRPWFVLHVLNALLSSLSPIGLPAYLVFFTGHARSLKTQISQPNTNTQRSGEQNKTLKTRQGYIKHVCKISVYISQKRHGHWTLKEIGDLNLNQPVFHVCVDASQQLIITSSIFTVQTSSVVCNSHSQHLAVPRFQVHSSEERWITGPACSRLLALWCSPCWDTVNDRRCNVSEIDRDPTHLENKLFGAHCATNLVLSLVQLLWAQHSSQKRRQTFS